jgi:hypothetical protein
MSDAGRCRTVEVRGSPIEGVGLFALCVFRSGESIRAVNALHALAVSDCERSFGRRLL